MRNRHYFQDVKIVCGIFFLLFLTVSFIFAQADEVNSQNNDEIFIEYKKTAEINGKFEIVYEIKNSGLNDIYVCNSNKDFDTTKKLAGTEIILNFDAQELIVKRSNIIPPKGKLLSEYYSTPYEVLKRGEKKEYKVIVDIPFKENRKYFKIEKPY